ncbi:mechanosensitive ion channel family protein [Methanogenium organophilum]|uniref:Mechanosensitive ion channel family protein n=1 Tax=Methanogenium organophilum TaxID=2199 RepID=A0A9X9S6F1_METOG|nr:mechanosensitive ion channel family protein [Methanogenium organophilum]WAI02280.1 mechanosensitive ion channel family protein [Methanogenium organophilum]
MQIFTGSTDGGAGGPLLNGTLNITPEALIFAVLALVIGYIAAKLIVRWVERMLRRQGHLTEVATGLLGRIISVLLYIIVVLIAVSFLGVDVNGIVLGLSAIIGLVIAFGMKDTVNNFAAGIWIASMNLFEKGEEVTIGGHWGIVQTIGIMATQLTAAGSNIITIPNGNVWNDSIINYTRNPERRIDQSFGVSYESDMTKVVQIALSIAKTHPKVLDSPEPVVIFAEMADSSVNFTLRCWTKTPDYYGARADILRSLHAELTAAGIEIPYPHVDVAFRNANAGEESTTATGVQ